MANIQSGINQIISLASLLATQNPAIKNRAARRNESSRVKSDIKNLDNIMDSVAAEYETTQPEPDSQEMEDYTSTMTDYTQQGAELKKKAFELNPSEKTYADYKSKKSEVGTLKSQLADIKARREQADARTLAMQEARRQTRASILEGTPSEYASEYPTRSSGPAASLDEEVE